MQQSSPETTNDQVDPRSASASPATGAAYWFGNFRLEPDGTLYRGSSAVHLPLKELLALRVLLAHAGQIVSPQQLREALWGGVNVTSDSVPRCMSSLRARLAPDFCVQTVYKRGYRLAMAVSREGGGPAQPIPRLAILPFAPGPGVASYLGSAIAEESAVRLSGARIPFVTLLAQDSVTTLAARGLSAQEVGAALRADLVLTGTLRLLPGHYRLRAEMIRTSDGAQIWLEDFLVVRDHAASLEIALANRLFAHLHGGGPSLFAAADEEAEGAGERREAYDLYQHAHLEWQTLERHRMQDGLQLLLRASEMDPSLAAARVDLVNLSVTQEFYGYMSAAVAAETARQAAAPWLPMTGSERWDRAVFENFAGRAEGMLPGLGWFCFHVNRDLAAAQHAFSLSAHLPHDAWTTRLRVMLELSRHRFPEAIEQLRAAIRQDPFSPWLHARLAWALHLDGQAEASVECIRHVLAQFPEHESTLTYGAILLAFNGRPGEAIELAQSLAARVPYFDIATAVHAYAQACAGRRDEARAILERLQWLGRERFVISSFNPAVHVALDDHEAALAALRASADSRCPWFFQMLADPRLRPLHAYPEFAAMRQVLGEMESAAASSPEPATE